MSITELLESVSELVKDFGFSANDHPEEVLRKEALRRESHTVLLLKKHLAKIEVVIDVFEL